MSRVINIKGKVIIKNIQLAKESITACGFNINIENNQFAFSEFYAWDTITESQKARELEMVEEHYSQKFSLYLDQIAEEQRAKIEEEKKVLREEKAKLIIANAEKQGYKVKKEIREDNTVKIVLQRRTY